MSGSGPVSRRSGRAKGGSESRDRRALRSASALLEAIRSKSAAESWDGLAVRRGVEGPSGVKLLSSKQPWRP